MKRYIITGAAGHLGSTILRGLKNTEAEVFGLLLPQERPVVQAENIRYFYGNVCKPETLEALFEEAKEGENIVIHTAGKIEISKKVSPGLYEVNVNGTKNMLRVCMRYPVARFLYVSTVHAIPEPPVGQKILETAYFSPELVVGGYAKTKAEATQAVLTAAGEGFPAIVVQPSGMLGPYDKGRNHLIQLVYDYIKGILPACVEGGFDFVDVRDVAKGCLLAAEKGTPGQCYILSGHYSTIYELLDCAGRYCNKAPLRMVPLGLAKAAVPFIALAAKLEGRRPLYTAYSLRTLTGNSDYSKEKAVCELGYRVRALEETVRDTVRWCLEN